MKELLFYPGQVIVASSILYGSYHVFLRNKKFHGYNRYFLLAAVILSIVIPFLNIPVYFSREQLQPSGLFQTLAVISTGSFNETSATDPVVMHHTPWFTVNNILAGCYGILALFMLGRFITGLIKLYRMTRKYTPTRISEITFFNTREEGTPFSFFRLLFWNQQIPMDTESGQQIFRHELFHIRQRHSYDIIFLEVLTIIFWFNPFFHLIRKELKTIHEFLADQHAMKGDEEWKYAELLVMQVLGSPNNRFSQPFFHNQIKRRIAMITSGQKPTGQYLRKLLVLPLAALLIVLFAFKYQAGETLASRAFTVNQPVTVVIDAGHGGKTGAVAADGTYEGDITLAVAQKIKELNKNDRICIVLTRNSAEEIDLRKRSDYANAQNPDLFISIHLNNATPGIQKTGFDVFISRKNQSFYPENKILGVILLNYFSSLYPVEKKIQQQEEGIWVLDNSKCPSALVECGYLSNAKDLAFIKKTANQEKVAQRILQAIEQYVTQKEAPDFNERKKTVADTTMPDLRLLRSSTGKVSGTLNGIAITGVLAVDHSMGFILANASLTVIPKEETKTFADRYGALWNDFIRSTTVVTSTAVKNQDKTATGTVFKETEIDPAFPGGEKAWQQYLQKNLNANVAVDHNASPGSYTVWVEFLVSKTGEVSEIKTLTNPGFGMEDEVVKLIKNGPKWRPGIQHGQNVGAYKKQPVTFVVVEEGT